MPSSRNGPRLWIRFLDVFPGHATLSSRRRRASRVARSFRSAYRNMMLSVENIRRKRHALCTPRREVTKCPEGTTAAVTAAETRVATAAAAVARVATAQAVIAASNAAEHVHSLHCPMRLSRGEICPNPWISATTRVCRRHDIPRVRTQWHGELSS